jgi:hypothetical protein
VTGHDALSLRSPATFSSPHVVIAVTLLSRPPIFRLRLPTIVVILPSSVSTLFYFFIHDLLLTTVLQHDHARIRMTTNKRDRLRPNRDMNKQARAHAIRAERANVKRCREPVRLPSVYFILLATVVQLRRTVRARPRTPRGHDREREGTSRREQGDGKVYSLSFYFSSFVPPATTGTTRQYEHARVRTLTRARVRMSTGGRANKYQLPTGAETRDRSQASAT